MRSKTPFYLLILICILTGIGLSARRHVIDKVPFFPGKRQATWVVEARVSFQATGGPVEVALSLPKDPAFSVLGQNAASPGYGLTISEDGSRRRADWTIREATSKQNLYFVLNLVPSGKNHIQKGPPPPLPEQVVWPEGLSTAAKAVIDQAWSQSASNLSFVRELARLLVEPNPSQNLALLLKQYRRSTLLSKLLTAAEIPAVQVYGLMLEDGRRRQTLATYVEVFENDSWFLFDPETGVEGRPDNLLLWPRGSQSILDLVGGHHSSVTFSIMRETRPAINTAMDLMAQRGPMPLSLYQLPLDEQSLFRGILLIPVGVLIVVFLHVMIGFKTSGTFAPVLIALAFIQTSLLNGVLGFVLVVAAGLIIRYYLSHLNLLLVARISAVVMVVIGIIASFTLIAYNLGLSEGLTITFFPMIILAWTIERMSIIWEEEGPKSVIQQGGGSLLTAIIAYLAMENPLVQHWAFHFLGIHFVIFGLILLMGQYTGYRLLELRRFAPITG